MEPTVEVYQNIKSKRIIATGPLRDYIDQPFKMRSKDTQCVYRVMPGCVVVDIDQDSEETIQAIRNNRSVTFAYRSFSGRGYHCVFIADWTTADQQAAAQRQAAASLGIEVDEFALGRNRPWILPRETHYAHINEAAVPLEYTTPEKPTKATLIDRSKHNSVRRLGHDLGIHYKARMIENGSVTYYGGDGVPYGDFYVRKNTLTPGTRKEGLKKMFADWIPVQHTWDGVNRTTALQFLNTWNARCCEPQLDRSEIQDLASEMIGRYLSGELSTELSKRRKAQASVNLEKEVRTPVQKSLSHLTKKAHEVTEIVNWVKATDATSYAARKQFPQLDSFIKRQWPHIQFVLQMSQVSIVVTEQQVIELIGQSKVTFKRSELSKPKGL